MLRPHQYDIVNHIVLNRRCAVWSSMGSGKTLATLVAIDVLQAMEDCWPILIVAPLRVASTVWIEEAKKWPLTQHLKIRQIKGSEAQREKVILDISTQIFTINFELLPWLSSYFKERWPYHLVVVDESTRLKGYRRRSGSVRARALVEKAQRSPRVITLTGTPAPNGLADLWGPTYMLDSGLRLSPSFNSYMHRFFNAKSLGRMGLWQWTPKSSAMRDITRMLKDITLNIDVKDYMDIAEPVVNKVMVRLPASARKVYKEMERAMYAELKSGPVEAFNAATKTGKCLQIANGAIYTDEGATQFEVLHDEKLQALESVIEEASGAPVLVAYHFRSDLERLKAAFPQGRELDTNPKTIKDWNAGKIPVLFAHPASAGHGLNLAEGGHILAFFSIDWNLETHLQVIERVGPARQAQLGTGKATLLYYILAEDTIDEVVFERLSTKKTVQEVLLEAVNRRTET